MKYWIGYLTAAIFAAFSWAFMQFGEKYRLLVDMVYPYVTKTLQSMLTEWTSGVDFLVWQTLAAIFLVLVISTLMVNLICKGNLVQWLGWVLAAVSVVFFLNTCVYGLNYYTDPITEDLRIEQTDYSLENLESAAVYYRDKANALAVQLPRDEKGAAKFSEFEVLAEQTAQGYKNLVLERYYSIFGGSYTPVKKLGWNKMYASMGITGITVPLTGESAVDPDIPGISLPFTMARETAHRMSIAQEDDSNFAAFLACQANSSVEYQYSGYFMAYQYCYNVLAQTDPAAAQRVKDGCVKELTWDINQYDQYFRDTKNETAVRLADQANEAYQKVSGDNSRKQPRATVCDMLVSWFIQENNQKVEEEEVKFDPYDETQVDLSGIVNAKPVETEAEG